MVSQPQPRLYSWYCNRLISAHKDRFFDRISMWARDSNRDRFGILNELSAFRVTDEADPIPRDQAQHAILEELCVERAIEIATESPNGIAVSWSGGVDSTAVICSFLLAGVPAENLRVLYTSDSVVEAPEIFEFFRKNRLHLQEKPKKEFISIYDSLQEDSIVFGWGADHLYHFFKLYEDRIAAMMPWQDRLSTIYAKHGCSEFLEHDVGAFQTYSQTLDWTIRSFFDFSVLINVGCRFSGLRDFFKNQCKNETTRSKVKIFFDAPSFVNWGYMNRDKAAFYFQRETNVDYKPELKNLIYWVTRDSTYRRTKGKEGSWSKQYPPMSQNTVMHLGVHDSTGYHFYKWANVLWGVTNHRTLVELYDSVMDRYLKNG